MAESVTSKFLIVVSNDDIIKLILLTDLKKDISTNPLSKIEQNYKQNIKLNFDY